MVGKFGNCSISSFIRMCVKCSLLHGSVPAVKSSWNHDQGPRPRFLTYLVLADLGIMIEKPWNPCHHANPTGHCNGTAQVYSRFERSCRSSACFEPGLLPSIVSLFLSAFVACYSLALVFRGICLQVLRVEACIMQESMHRHVPIQAGWIQQSASQAFARTPRPKT